MINETHSLEQFRESVQGNIESRMENHVSVWYDANDSILSPDNHSLGGYSLSAQGILPDYASLGVNADDAHILREYFTQAVSTYNLIANAETAMPELDSFTRTRNVEMAMHLLNDVIARPIRADDFVGGINDLSSRVDRLLDIQHNYLTAPEFSRPVDTGSISLMQVYGV